MSFEGVQHESAMGRLYADLPSKVKAGRAALGWSQGDLEKMSGVSKVAIARLEVGKIQPRLATIAQIIKTFNDNGIHFIDLPTGGYFMAVLSPSGGKAEHIYQLYRGQMESRRSYVDALEATLRHGPLAAVKANQ